MANKTMKITILCDQTDCIHCKGGYTAHVHAWETRCKEPDGVIIHTHKGCLSKQTKYPPSKRF